MLISGADSLSLADGILKTLQNCQQVWVGWLVSFIIGVAAGVVANKITEKRRRRRLTIGSYLSVNQENGHIQIEGQLPNTATAVAAVNKMQKEISDATSGSSTVDH